MWLDAMFLIAFVVLAGIFVVLLVEATGQSRAGAPRIHTFRRQNRPMLESESERIANASGHRFLA